MLKKNIISMNSTLEKFIPKYYDVGVNITDSMFNGNYHGKIHHQNDIIQVLKKAFKHHVNDVLLTGSSLSESNKTIEIIQSLKNEINLPNLYSTVGIHPCAVLEFENASISVDDHLFKLENLINKGIKLNIIRAFGEIGLDYDRLNFTPIDKQLIYFEKQLNLATKFNLPLFLHMRTACDDFIKILKPFLEKNLLINKNLLIHSFTGNKLELEKLLNLNGFNNYNIYISLNGASLRDNSTLDIIHLIPLNRLMIETDSPWCEIKKSHPSYKYLEKSPNIFYPCDYENYNNIGNDVKEILNSNTKKNLNLSLHEFLPIPIVKSDKFDSFKYKSFFEDTPLIKNRNEPCLIGLVAQVISKITKQNPQLIIESAYNNSKQVFG
ncbi:hypothetical protein C6P42_002253 [Pichia californica]|nr:hypothetical protein C6P42_002253 [[Candida] californica]